jgi:hypothetical protein
MGGLLLYLNHDRKEQKAQPTTIIGIRIQVLTTESASLKDKFRLEGYQTTTSHVLRVFTIQLHCTHRIILLHPNAGPSADNHSLISRTTRIQPGDVDVDTCTADISAQSLSVCTN